MPTSAQVFAGLTPAALERLFDAFHTTKPNGLRLGFSICDSIETLTPREREVMR